jgi:hypothetical protein
MTGFLARPVALRWLGFFGSVCCAIDGFLFGAARSIRPDVTVWSILRGPNGVIIMLLWVVGLVAICTAWWKGRHLVGRGILTPRWVLVTAALWILPMIFIPPLASRDMYAYACQGALFGSGHNPYHDSISAQPCPWIDSVSVRWRFTLTPYGPLFIPLSAIAAKLGSLTAAIAAFRALAVISVAGMAAGMYALARRAGVPVDRALWLLMCCPLVPLHLVAGGHNDGLTVAFLVAGFALIVGADRGYPALLAGGALLGLSMSVKTTIGLVLPFAALLAAGGFAAGGWSRLLRRGGAVLAGALGTLLVLSAATGLGLGWIGALSNPGESVSWTSPPTAVGIAADAVGKWFGLHWNAVPVARTVALVALAGTLAAIFWHTRNSNQLYGAGLACVALIFMAPIAQPWYLTWALALFAATLVRTRWFHALIVFSMFTVLPDGDGTLKPLQVPLAFVMTAVVVWATWRGFAWLRSGLEPTFESLPEPVPGRPEEQATPA